MSDTQLKSLAERIERLMDERDGIQSDIRDIYTEAKSAGFVPKVLRKAITRKRMDPDKRDEEDTILDLYEDALSPTMRKVVSMAKAGASSHQIEAETGVDHATVARSVALNKKSATKPPHDPETGVITETAESPLGESRSPAASGGDSTEPPVPTREDGSAGEREPIPPAVARVLRDTLRAAEDAAMRSEEVARVAPPEPSSDPWDSVGPMPAGLRRAG